MGPPDPTEALLAAARAGRPGALGELLERHSNYLRLLARLHLRRFPGCKEDAADVLQETLIAAHHGFDQFRGENEASWLAWLRRILANRLSNIARKYLATRQRDARREVNLQKDLDASSAGLSSILEDGGPTPSAVVMGREIAVRLADAMAKLPDDYREVLVLRNLEEKSFPEIAAQMGRSLDSVKNLWARAVAKMRQAVGE